MVILMSSQQVSDDLYAIIEDLIDKSNRNEPIQSHDRNQGKVQEQNQSSAKRTNNAEKTKSHQLKENSGTIKLSNLSFKELLNTKKDLTNLKHQLVNSKNPRQYKDQLIKINKIEQKVDHAMINRRQIDIQKSIHSLQKNPRYYALQVIQTKDKVSRIKSNLEKNPRQNQRQLEKINHVEKRLNQKLQRMKTTQLNKTINIIQKNPKKYRQELTKFKTINRKLEKQQSQNQQKLKAHQKNQQMEVAKRKHAVLSR